MLAEFHIQYDRHLLRLPRKVKKKHLWLLHIGEGRETWLSTNKESEIFSDLLWNAVQRTAPDDGREDRYREGDIGI